MLLADLEPAMSKTRAQIDPIEPQMPGKKSDLLGAKGSGCLTH
jgi:hypothetical protein